MDEDTCMVDFARYFLDFAQKESCGECVPCRLGTKQLLSILEDITAGKGSPEDIDLLLELAQGIKAGALCGLGQTAPNPVLTTIRYFRDEYEAHVRRKRCPAVACRELISSPCQYVCPIGTQAPVYISLIAQGRFQEAFDVILEDNPLPSVCARVCHHPCESKCQAGQGGSPIAIRALKRFAADYAHQAGTYPGNGAPAGEAARGEKVAIVGAGPAGLTAAYQLARGGYDVTIFEALSVAGGALAAYIPEYRLPRDRLNADIKNITNAGVKIRTNTRIGEDISLEDLKGDHRAVFLAAGAHKSKRMGIAGEDAEGVLDAMEFLGNANLHRGVQVGRRVGIIGGGNAAVDAARVAMRLEQCEQVVIIYRRTRAEMPAFEEEVDAADEEGIRLQILTAPTRIVSKGGRLTGVECIRTELGEPDSSGRRRPVPVEGSEYLIELDTLIVAIGEGNDLSFLGGGHGIGISRWGTLEVDPQTLATGADGIFAGGDVVSGPATVVEAMAAGKLAAEMIDKYIRGEPLKRQYTFVRPSMYVPPVELSEEEIEHSQRPDVPSLPAGGRVGSFAEVELNLSPESAVREARRCLRCDLETEDARRQLARQPLEEGCACG